MKKLQQDSRRAHQIISRIAHDETVNDEAVAELVSLGEAALEALSATIDVDHFPSQRAAAMALARMGTRRALAPMLNTVSKVRSHPELVSALLNSAALLLEPRDKERVRPFLLRCLQHDSPSVRLAAVECIRATDDEEALSAVAGLNRDPDERVQAEAAQFLSKVHHHNQATVPRAASMELIFALGSRSETERRDARNALLRHPDRNRVVVEHLYHSDPYVRRSVLEVAAVVGEPAWHEALLDIAKDSERSDQERSLALRGLQRLAPNGVDDAFILQLTSHPSAFVRAEAARLAATTSREPLASAALGLLENDEPWVRKRIAEGWAGSADSGRQHELPALIAILSNAPWLREASMLDVEAYQSLCGGMVRMVELGGFIDASLLDELAMLRLHGPMEIAEITRRTLETLSRSTGIYCSVDRIELDVQALYDDDPKMRMRALHSLREESEPVLKRIIPNLIRFLYSATADELVVVTELLQQVRDRRAIEAVIRMAGHPDPRVRAAAEGRAFA